MALFAALFIPRIAIAQPTDIREYTPSWKVALTVQGMGELKPPAPEPEPAPVSAAPRKAAPPSASPSELVNKYAAMYGVSPLQLYWICSCESTNGEAGIDPAADNPSSSASGACQFLTKSWHYYGGKLWGSTAGKSVWSADNNIELAAYVMSTSRGTKDWTESRSCWAGRVY